MWTVKLVDVIAQLNTLDPALTIYAAKPWTCDSEVVLAREPDSGNLPEDAAAAGMSYFIEVFIAQDFLEGWQEVEPIERSPKDRCRRLIEYAIYDA